MWPQVKTTLSQRPSRWYGGGGNKVGRGAGDDLAGVMGVEEEGSQRVVGAAVDTVVDLQPALGDPEGRRPGPRAQFVPHPRAGEGEGCVVAPVDEVVREGDPHAEDSAKRLWHWPCERGEAASDPPGEEHHVLLVGGKHHTVAVERAEVPGREPAGAD